ncbi:MAG: type I DNA topoisomerase [Bacteroidota bacterium]
MAKKKLVIVESATKSKTINKYLGKDFIVEASVGHIKDLSKFNLGIDIKQGFAPKYVVISGKSKVINKLKATAEKASEVLIATDPDREGEAIAWHIAEEIKPINNNIKRIVFNEITKSGIEKGISQPRQIDERMVDSQQARRVMDRLIGFQVSPFVSKAMISKTTDPLSAGRVQSVALRLICEREQEIQSFKPIEYWNIFGDFSFEGSSPFQAKLIAFHNKSIKNPDGSAEGKTDEETKKIQAKLSKLHFIRNKEQAEQLIAEIKQNQFVISDIKTTQVRKKSSAPFTTSTLQQEASRKLGFANKKTMQIAQQLYEGVSFGDEGQIGLITYMRTDSVRISPEAIASVRQFIEKSYGKQYLPDSPNIFSTKSANVQDAHEAIRPTSVEITPQIAEKHLSKDQAKLYRLIYNRFIASQMESALLEQTVVSIEGGSFLFRATGTIVKFDGFMTVYQDTQDNTDKDEEQDALLPKNIAKNKNVELLETEAKQSFTKPPARYNEASLVKELDELGIGRPSTYAQIVSTLLERKYVEKSGKAFSPTELGKDVNEILVSNFPDIFNVEFTAKMEEELDTIAEGKSTYVQVLTEFYEPFSKALTEADRNETDVLCDECGAPMVIKVSRRGRFLACSRYPDCTFTKSLKKETKPVIAEGVTCDKCGSPMAIRKGRYGNFYGCTNYPKCDGTKPISSSVTCPSCKEGHLVEKYSPKSKKKFWGCSTYPKCNYITNYEPVAKECPECGNYYLEVRYKKVASGFEKYLHCPHCKAKFEENTD